MSFNERTNINGQAVSDQQLLESFENVELARGDTPITFFEFGTLLALDLFSKANADIAIMEVGLGGRLDAVNILDHDISVITSIARDHIAWLGDTIEKIAYEKAGIARANRPLLVGISKPPASILKHAAEVEALVHVVGHDFDYSLSQDKQSWD